MNKQQKTSKKKEYTIKVGEIFTQEKADELIEYLRLKDGEIIELERRGKKDRYRITKV